MAILFTMLFCSYPRYFKTEPLTAGRKLSSGDSSDEAAPAWCVEAHFESGYSASGESEEESAPAPKLAKLDSFGLIPPRETVLRYAPPRSQRSETPLEFMNGSRRSMEELEAASALIHLQQTLEAVGEISKRAQSHGDSLPSAATLPPREPSTRTTLAGHHKPQIASPLLVQLLLSPSPKPQPPTSARELTPSAAEVREQFIRTRLEGIRGRGDHSNAGKLAASQLVVTSDTSEAARTRVAGAAEGAQPSVSSGIPAPSLEASGGVHPFYRVPSVNPMDQTMRRFSPQKALSAHHAYAKIAWRLPLLRRLLAKASLTSPELSHLAELTACVLAHVRYFENTPTQNIAPFRAVRLLGRRFVTLDAAIAALQALGETASGDWWDTIVGSMPDHTTHASRPGGSNELIIFNDNLLKRLADGLRTLKTGVRLSMEETISIKRLLFCSPLSPSYFKGPGWDGWRQDDSDFDGTS
ncbi:hypothetical protein Emag_005092 [Eimeria magna]